MMKILLSILLLLATPAVCQDVKIYIPPQAYNFFPIVESNVKEYFPTLPETAYMLGLMEHESCISLKHSKCLNAKSRLKTSREEGAGVGQLTRAFKADGSIRFDSLAAMRDKYSSLKELSWNTIYERPDLQVRTMVLMSRDSYKSLYKVSDDYERMYFMDASYNQGLGGTQRDRMKCGLAKGCNPQLWFGNVENQCTASKTAIYGQRSPCDISRHHVADVFHNRLPKYKKAMEK